MKFVSSDKSANVEHFSRQGRIPDLNGFTPRSTSLLSEQQRALANTMHVRPLSIIIKTPQAHDSRTTERNEPQPSPVP